MPDLTGTESQAHLKEEEESPEPLQFTVLSQKLNLEIDFPTRSLKGTAVLEIQPWNKDLKSIKLNSRQCKVSVDDVTVDGRACKVEWEDVYKRMALLKNSVTTAENWRFQKEKIEALAENRSKPELEIHLPKGFVIREANDEQLGALSNRAEIGSALAAVPTSAANSDAEYLPIHVSIPFSVENPKDGLHFVGLEEGDVEWAHVYTQQSSTSSGISRCIFPCFDNPKVKPQWKITIKCARTLGDALTRRPAINGHPEIAEECNEFGLDDEEKLLEMVAVCSGDRIIDGDVDPADNKKKIYTFEVPGNMVCAGHIAFAVGPFEFVNLSDQRGDEDNVKLGQSAVKVNAYCLPGRSEQVENAAQPLALAMDFFCITYGAYPFADYTMCFVAGQVQDTVDSASMTLCSDRLLHPEEVIDELQPHLRKFVHSLARQYSGVSLLPENPEDSWIVVGIARFLTDNYLSELFGYNEIQFDIKQRAERVMELDKSRPSLLALGSILNLGAFEHEFMELKAPIVLHMLDRRISKDTSQTSGLNRIISKIFTAVNTGGSTDDARTITTDHFHKVCQKLCKDMKLTDFFKQWVYGAGYPRLSISQKYSKKNMKIVMSIKQVQHLDPGATKLQKAEFAREVKEDQKDIYECPVSSTFTGSMSIRVHEADGTPYEHTFVIDSREKTIEIPYNCKYKRLRKSRKEKERDAARGGDLDGIDDVLVYCLGDGLQTQEECNEWKLEGWDQETLTRADNEPFEWISIDVDHEWTLSVIDHSMEPYMWTSQLQQDRDVVAHANAVKVLTKLPPSQIISSVLVRTVMDPRHFHGVRALAAEGLAAHAKATSNWIGKFHLEKAFHYLFCYPESKWTPLPNDFSNWQNYYVQTALATSMAKIRDDTGNCPLECRKFILDQLRLNDNTDSEFSDSFYIAKLLEALGDSMIPVKISDGTLAFAADMDEEEKEALQTFQQNAIEEIERYKKIDMTMGSWKNVFTIACLNSKKRLMQAGIIPIQPAEFLKYLNDDTADVVQIGAMSAIVELGLLLKYDTLLRLCLFRMTYSSPFLRDQHFRLFWRAMASQAFGEHLEKEPEAVADGLVVYQGQDQADARAARIGRTTTIELALNALRADLVGNQVLKSELWQAVQSSSITLGEQITLLDYCSLLYEPKDTLLLIYPLPRYLVAKNLGKGKLAFLKTGNPRQHPIPKYVPPPEIPSYVPSMENANSSITMIKLKLPKQDGEMGPPAKAPKPAAPARSTPLLVMKNENKPPRAESESSSSTITSQPRTKPAPSSAQAPVVSAIPKARKPLILRFQKNSGILDQFPRGVATPRIKRKSSEMSSAPQEPPIQRPAKQPKTGKSTSKIPANMSGAAKESLDLIGGGDNTPHKDWEPRRWLLKLKICFNPSSATAATPPAPAKAPASERKPLPSGRTSSNNSHTAPPPAATNGQTSNSNKLAAPKPSKKLGTATNGLGAAKPKSKHSKESRDESPLNSNGEEERAPLKRKGPLFKMSSSSSDVNGHASKKQKVGPSV